MSKYQSLWIWGGRRVFGWYHQSNPYFVSLQPNLSRSNTLSCNNFDDVGDKKQDHICKRERSENIYHIEGETERAETEGTETERAEIEIAETEVAETENFRDSVMTEKLQDSVKTKKLQDSVKTEKLQDSRLKNSKIP